MTYSHIRKDGVEIKRNPTGRNELQHVMKNGRRETRDWESMIKFHKRLQRQDSRQEKECNNELHTLHPQMALKRRPLHFSIRNPKNSTLKQHST